MYTNLILNLEGKKREKKDLHLLAQPCVAMFTKQKDKQTKQKQYICLFASSSVFKVLQPQVSIRS